MKDFTFSIYAARMVHSNKIVHIVDCYEGGKWRESYSRPTETEARSIGDIWVAEQQEMETFAEPVEFTQETVFVEMVECTFSWLKDIPKVAFSNDIEEGLEPAMSQNDWAQYYEDLDAQYEQNRADQFAYDDLED